MSVSKEFIERMLQVAISQMARIANAEKKKEFPLPALTNIPQPILYKDIPENVFSYRAVDGFYLIHGDVFHTTVEYLWRIEPENRGKAIYRTFVSHAIFAARMEELLNRNKPERLRTIDSVIDDGVAEDFGGGEEIDFSGLYDLDDEAAKYGDPGKYLALDLFITRKLALAMIDGGEAEESLLNLRKLIFG